MDSDKFRASFKLANKMSTPSKFRFNAMLAPFVKRTVCDSLLDRLSSRVFKIKPDAAKITIATKTPVNNTMNTVTRLGERHLMAAQEPQCSAPGQWCDSTGQRKWAHSV